MDDLMKKCEAAFNFVQSYCSNASTHQQALEVVEDFVKNIIFTCTKERYVLSSFIVTSCITHSVVHLPKLTDVLTVASASVENQLSDDAGVIGTRKHQEKHSTISNKEEQVSGHVNHMEANSCESEMVVDGQEVLEESSELESAQASRGGAESEPEEEVVESMIDVDVKVEVAVGALTRVSNESVNTVRRTARLRRPTLKVKDAKQLRPRRSKMKPGSEMSTQKVDTIQQCTRSCSKKVSKVTSIKKAVKTEEDVTVSNIKTETALVATESPPNVSATKDMSFLSDEDYIKFREDLDNWPCLLCGDRSPTWPDKDSFVEHIKEKHTRVRKDGRTVVRCLIGDCKKEMLRLRKKSYFASIDQLVPHVVLKHQKPVPGYIICEKCDVCGEVIYSRYKIRAHRKKHEAKVKIPCEVCGLAFIKPALNVHKTSCHARSEGKMDSRTTYPCPECKQTFWTKGNLQCHVDRVHKKKNSFLCSFCSASFYAKTDFEYHMYVKHKLNLTKRKVVKCDLCDYLGLEGVMIRKHMKNHVKGSFWCTEKNCQKVFGTKNGLNAHKVTHKTKDQYSCPEADCPFTSNKSYFIKRHIQMVHRGKKWKCRTQGCTYVGISEEGFQQHIAKGNHHFQPIYKNRKLKLPKQVPSEVQVAKAVEMVHMTPAQVPDSMSSSLPQTPLLHQMPESSGMETVLSEPEQSSGNPAPMRSQNLIYPPPFMHSMPLPLGSKLDDDAIPTAVMQPDMILDPKVGNIVLHNEGIGATRHTDMILSDSMPVADFVNMITPISSHSGLLPAELNPTSKCPVHTVFTQDSELGSKYPVVTVYQASEADTKFTVQPMIASQADPEVSAINKCPIHQATFTQADSISRFGMNRAQFSFFLDQVNS